jgi:hypothetical protein
MNFLEFIFYFLLLYNNQQLQKDTYKQNYQFQKIKIVKKSTE